MQSMKRLMFLAAGVHTPPHESCFSTVNGTVKPHPVPIAVTIQALPLHVIPTHFSLLSYRCVHPWSSCTACSVALSKRDGKNNVHPNRVCHYSVNVKPLPLPVRKRLCCSIQPSSLFTAHWVAHAAEQTFHRLCCGCGKHVLCPLSVLYVFDSFS